MAYDGYDNLGYDNIGYDERNVEHAALRDAASASKIHSDKHDDRHDDLAVGNVDEQEQNSAQWGEGAPACLAAVIFAQRRWQAQAHGHDEYGDNPSMAGRERPAEHI